MTRKKSDLRAYQQRAITHFYETDAVQAVIPMGGGKTAVALTAADELIEDGEVRCALVIAPKKVAQLVWPAEPQEWEHLQHLVVVYVEGDERARLAALERDADVYTIGIHHLPWLVKHLKTLPTDHKLFDLLIIDESSKLKAPRGKWGRALSGICRRWKIKWWLTGTPRPNGYEDQFRPLAILTGGKVWGTLLFDKWREKNFQKMDFMGYDWRIRPEHEPKIIRKIQSVTFTVDDSEMPELDPVTNVYHWVDLPPSAMRVYKEMEKKMIARYGDDPAVLAANAAVATGKLAQIAQGFFYHKKDGQRGVTRLHDEKTNELVRLTEELAGYPALVVYDFVEDLDVMRGLWPGFPYLGDDTTDEDAARYEKAWNAKQLPLFGLHPASAAHGLNLQFGGQQIIFHGMPWSAELYDQIIKRIQRPGQVGKVFAHHILARGTVDELKLSRVRDKISDQEAFRRYLKRI
jgi:hypothetical protein